MAQNWFATIALLSWPMVALWLYRSRPIGLATIWTILGALLLLPVGAVIKFEGIPQFDKISIPNLAALIGCILVTRRPFRFWSGFGLTEVLLVMYLIGPFVTAELNTDVIYIGKTVLPAESHYDALSDVVRQLLFLLPFFMGRQLLRSSADNVEILRVLVIAGLLYSFLILFELRMGPQLGYLIYGYQAQQHFPIFSRRRISAGRLHGTPPTAIVLYDDDHHRSGCILANANSRNAISSNYHHCLPVWHFVVLQERGSYCLRCHLAAFGPMDKTQVSASRRTGPDCYMFTLSSPPDYQYFSDQLFERSGGADQPRTCNISKAAL